MKFSINDFNEIIISVYLYNLNYPKFNDIEKKVNFLIDVYVSRNSTEEHINIIKTFPKDISYRSEKEHALKLSKENLMPNIINKLIELNLLKVY
jgi:hypothetical protein